jgi:hypothetical protein
MQNKLLIFKKFRITEQQENWNLTSVKTIDLEIIGTQMGQGDISTVKEEAIEITSLPPSPNATNMTENVRNNPSQAAGDNASQTGGSIVNQTGEAAQTFMNKTASVVGNVSGEVSELFGANK